MQNVTHTLQKFFVTILSTVHIASIAETDCIHDSRVLPVGYYDLPVNSM